MERNFDYLYLAEDWECTFYADDLSEFAERHVEETNPGTVVEVSTLIEGPKKYAARVPLSFDDDGSWDEQEVQFFDTKEEAEKAANRTA